MNRARPRPNEGDIAAAGFIAIDEVIAAARANLDDGPWAYLTGGSESETTVRRNRLAFDRWALRPRVLVDVSHLDPSTEFLGQKMRIPVLLAPIRALDVLHPDGAGGVARAAAEFGTIQVVANGTRPNLETPANAAPGPKLFQFLANAELPSIRDKLERARKAGYVGVALTVDAAVPSRRERHMRSGWADGRADGRSSADVAETSLLTWENVGRLRDAAGLPFILKGIQTAEDAALAVDHGVDVVWVSNHGGRQLDHALGTLDTLPEIVEVVGGRARIVLDGGIQRGTDVIKALALGADAVAVGKLEGWGLAAGGKDGVVRVLEILEDEIRVAMGLLGITRLGDLGPAYVTRAEPVTRAHEMSSWIGLAEKRLV